MMGAILLGKALHEQNKSKGFEYAHRALGCLLIAPWVGLAQDAQKANPAIADMTATLKDTLFKKPLDLKKVRMAESPLSILVSFPDSMGQLTITGFNTLLA